MKEPHGKGIANHSNPESCAGGGTAAGEALTRAHAGQPLSSEIILPACRPCAVNGEGHTLRDDHRKSRRDAAESKNLSMRGNSLHGNRETLETPPPDSGEGRSAKAYSRTADTHVSGESDGPIVPKKRANNAGLKAVAESVEGRGPTKRNAERTLLLPDTEPGPGGIGSRGVRAGQSGDPAGALVVITRGRSRMK